jgi:hypothetical protein
MSIAKEIINGLEPAYDRYVSEGYSLDDMDEYGFTPLIEAVISERPSVAEELIKRGVDINKEDIMGRTALHWAVDQSDLSFARFLLSKGANPNSYDKNGLSILVYPILRVQNDIKHLLYQHGAKLDFALDFINGKLLGHRFELKGDADILTPTGEFIELNYEGFILEFTVAIVKDSLRRFTSSYSTRHLRHQFSYIHAIMDGFMAADELLKMQHIPVITPMYEKKIAELMQTPVLILPAASRGHALCFVRHGEWWAKIDRGENSLQEGSVNIYRITKPNVLTTKFIQEFLFNRQPREYFHQKINTQLGLKPMYKLPLSSQITGNCSWANVQGIIPVAYALQQLQTFGELNIDESMMFFYTWSDWDQDRALDDCIQRFYLADPIRRVSLAGMLGAVLFQSCDAANSVHLQRAEKILHILTLPEYYYILKSYLKHYCEKRLTVRGNNLLKLLDDCGVNSKIDVAPIATPLKERK